MDLIQKAKNLGCIIKNDEYYLWEIQKWLREEHNFHIIVESLYEEFAWRGKKEGPSFIGGVEKSYEEALEKGLQEALKLI